MLTERTLNTERAVNRRLETADIMADAAKRRCEAARLDWTRDGTLVQGAELAKRWGRNRQALDQVGKRGELFHLVGGDPVSKLIFWDRRHGGLGGRTAMQALLAGELARVVELAEGFAKEHGWV